MRKQFLILLFISSFAHSQPMQMLIAKKKSGTITAPSFISENETSWANSTSPKTTASISANSGDILVAVTMIEDATDVSISDNSSLSWTLHQDVNVAGYSRCKVWSASVPSTTSTMTVTFTLASGTSLFGGNVFVWRGSAGVGASAKTNVASGAPSLSLTTTVDNSAIITANVDRNAFNGTPTWRTINSITPSGSGTCPECTAFRDGAHYTVGIAHYTNAGTAGSKTTGISSPSGQKYSIISVEVKGQGFDNPISFLMLLNFILSTIFKRIIIKIQI